MNTGVKVGLGALAGAIFGLPVAYEAYKRLRQGSIARAQTPNDITDEKVCKELNYYYYNRACHKVPY